MTGRKSKNLSDGLEGYELLRRDKKHDVLEAVMICERYFPMAARTTMIREPGTTRYIEYHGPDRPVLAAGDGHVGLTACLKIGNDSVVPQTSWTWSANLVVLLREDERSTMKLTLKSDRGHLMWSGRASWRNETRLRQELSCAVMIVDALEVDYRKYEFRFRQLVEQMHWTEKHARFGDGNTMTKPLLSPVW